MSIESALSKSLAPPPLLSAPPDWLDTLPDFVTLELLQPGVLLMRYHGQLGSEHIDQMLAVGARLRAWTSSRGQYFYLLFDAGSLELRDLSVRYQMLRRLRWEPNPFNLRLELVTDQPLLLAIAKILLRFNPATPMRCHLSLEEALAQLRHDLGQDLALPRWQRVERPELSHVSADGKCRLDFSVLGGQIVHVRLRGGLRLESVNHLMDVQHRLCAELADRPRLYSIGQVLGVTHDQQVAPALKLLQQRLGAEPLPFEKSYTIMPPAFRGVVSLLKRLIPVPLAHVGMAETLDAALAAIEAYESLMGSPIEVHPVLPTGVAELQALVRRQQQELLHLHARQDAQLERLEEVVGNMVLNSDFTPLAPEPVPPHHPLASLTDLAYVLQFDLRNLIDTLRSEIREREAAQLEAAAASEVKSRFLATMSHEIRTPLNAVLGFSKVLLKQTGRMSPEQQRIYIERIQQNGLNLLALVNDILDLSRIEAGQLEIRFESVDLSALLARSGAQFELEARQRGLDLRVETPEKLEIVADSLRLAQVVNNLLQNALKFTERGGVQLRAHQQTGAILIEVEDTGIGIPAERQADIFEAFTQIDNRFQRRYAGSGLGLAISRELCQLMGFRLELESAAGQGACFRILVPVEGVAV